MAFCDFIVHYSSFTTIIKSLVEHRFEYLVNTLALISTLKNATFNWKLEISNIKLAFINERATTNCYRLFHKLHSTSFGRLHRIIWSTWDWFVHFVCVFANIYVHLNLSAFIIAFLTEMIRVTESPFICTFIVRVFSLL